MIVKTLLFLLVGFRINAQNIEIPVGRDYTSMQFRMNRMDVRFQESTIPKVVIVGIKDRDAWSFRKDAAGILVVEEKNYDSQLFASTPSGAKDKWIVKIPSGLSMSVTGTDLDISGESLKNSVQALIFKGQVKGFKNQGEWRIFMNVGEVNLDAHTAPVFVNGSQVKFSMKNSTGDAKISNYSGSVVLDKNSGHNSVFNYQGTINLNQITGSSQIELSKGNVQIAQSQGRHDIVTEDANVDLKATKESDFNVKMKNGKLTYGSAGTTGVWLNLSSKEADLFLTAPMKPQKIKTETFYRGRTSGEKSAARLEVKTVNAPIIVR